MKSFENDSQEHNKLNKMGISSSVMSIFKYYAIQKNKWRIAVNSFY
jgi:hypothetical protein